VAPKKVERAGGPKRILLVEDAIFFRQLRPRLSGGGGYAVETAENGREGLETPRGRRFDLLVSDIEMPVMDGWDS
jgi:CheY-like chemotaxis protein